MSQRAFLIAACVSLLVTAASANAERWAREGWKTDFGKTLVPLDEIMSGGPPRDGIPSIDDPKFIAASKEADLGFNEPVIGFEISGDARAYPLRILIWHEIVNDTVGGIPVAVTYCPLCNASVVFDRRLDGQLFDFGTTGKLRKSDLVMYDRQTESWWQQFTGEAIVGALIGKRLRILPARLESFSDFRDRHPEGKVLVPNDPTMRRYGSNPYVGYDTSGRPFLYKGDLPEDIEPLARVVVVRTNPNEPLIVSMAHLRSQGLITIGRIELSWRDGQNSALNATEISKGRDVGTVEAIQIATDGSREPIAYDVTFAFAAHAFHPETPIVTD
jgi:hypothetical protein